MVVKGITIQLPSMNYEDYSVKDFILDESFQKWVLEPDEATNAAWEGWLKLHPAKQATVDEARNIIISIGFRNDLPSQQDFAEVWDNIVTANNRPVVKIRPSYSKSTSKNITALYKVATFFLLFVLAGGLYLYWSSSDQYITYITNYGETRTILLPDSSKIYLNANSSLKYLRNWNRREPREVWLSGEAFFDVKRKAGEAEEVHASHPDRFMVHTHQLNVIVLGTQFNVNDRRGKTKVVLHSGKVKLQAGNNPDILMEPGELAELNSDAGKLVKKAVDINVYNSWINKQLIFDNTPLYEVAATLEDNYGMKIEFAEGIAQERFTGTIPTDNINIFFTILSESLNVNIVRNDNQINVNYKNLN